MTAGGADYRFGPGDVIEITLAPQQELDRIVTVQPDGKISFPFVGPFPAAGLTIAELAEKLRRQLNRDLVSPHVTVSLKEINNHAVPRVSVLGAGKKPGSVRHPEVPPSPRPSPRREVRCRWRTCTG